MAQKTKNEKTKTAAKKTTESKPKAGEPAKTSSCSLAGAWNQV